ncbi:hypothetical protein [Actinomadura sp. K4S16]|uniref:hypothetical protein n=1 Tax=Actinomadura sp. K4S16 TaxID=1316147 RepID=UPI0011F05DFA|nr:hypothetical protein [Actinomadura sp. K4S16]
MRTDPTLTERAIRQHGYQMGDHLDGTGPGRCARCGRRSSAHMGRICRAKVLTALRELGRTRYAHKPRLVARAEELLDSGGVVLLRGRICRTVGSDGAVYLTHPLGCNCPAGLRSRHLCHHRIAVDAFTSTLPDHHGDRAAAA